MLHPRELPVTSCGLHTVLAPSGVRNRVQTARGQSGGGDRARSTRRAAAARAAIIVGMPDAVALAALLAAHPGTLVLTGAGISTDSGIPDYRGPDGTAPGHPDAARRVRRLEPGPAALLGQVVHRLAAVQRTPSRTPPTTPSPTSSAAALLGPVITQNVDGLHQAAGSRAVTELHGSLAEVLCLTCGDRSDRDLLQARMAEANWGFEALAAW